MVKFTISKKEIERRKRAYATLVFSLLFGLAVSSLDFIFANFAMAISILGVYTLAFLALWLLTYMSFQHLSQTSILLGSESIERKANVSEKLLYRDIRRIKIKRTSRGSIREVKIVTEEGKSMIISALASFSKFEKALLRKCSPKTKIRRTHEPVDYDHPLFYFFFGSFLGLVSTVLIRFLAGFDIANLAYFYIALLMYTFIVGLYMIITRPISKHFGIKTQIYDIVFGIVFIIIDLVMIKILV